MFDFLKTEKTLEILSNIYYYITHKVFVFGVIFIILAYLLIR